MKTHLNICLISIVLALSTIPCSLKSQAQRTEVMLLGTTHLQNAKGFESQMLTRVLEQLGNYTFQAVGIEAMPTELLYDIKSRRDTTFEDLLATYGGWRLEVADSMQMALGYGFPEADGKAQAILEKTTLTDIDRLELIKNLMASGDLHSSVLHYQAMENPKLLEGHFPISYITELKKRVRSHNEIYSIGMAVAVQNDLWVLNYIDDLQDEPLLFQHFQDFVPDYMDNQDFFAEVLTRSVFHTLDSLEKSCVANEDFLPLFSYLNSERYRQDDYAAQWRIWLESSFQSKSDRSRYALWEMRNLMIAARIMKLAAFHPGERILIIIGASHTSFLKKYLGQAQNIALIPFH